VKAIIVAGGEGRRIGSVAKGVPKPLLEIGGRPVVEHQLRLLRRYGVGEVHLTVRAEHLAVFKERFADGKPLGLALHYHAETEPLGTAGGIGRILEKFPGEFFVLYGDVMVNMDLAHLAEFHRSRRAAATLVVHPTDHPADSDLVELGESGRIRAFHPKPRPPGFYCRNVANAGLYVLSPAVAGFLPQGPGDFVRDVFPRALRGGAPLFGYATREYLRDIGSPARLESVGSDWASGKVEKSHLDYALPAVFLDRDGTLCELVRDLHRIEDLRLVPGAAEAVRRLNESFYLAVVVTNQPVVARGLCTLEQLDRIHAKLETLLGERGAKLDALYFCPHHPDPGSPSENPKFKLRCECRKPSGGLIRRAVAELNIDLARSVMIGDSTVDIETGKRAGIRTILVLTGEAGRDGKFAVRPDARCADLAEAIGLVLDRRAWDFATSHAGEKKPATG